jgi:hypothetical protein
VSSEEFQSARAEDDGLSHVEKIFQQKNTFVQKDHAFRLQMLAKNNTFTPDAEHKTSTLNTFVKNTQHQSIIFGGLKHFEYKMFARTNLITNLF